MGGRKYDISGTSGHQIPFIELGDDPRKPKTNYFASFGAIVASMSSILGGYGEKISFLPLNSSPLSLNLCICLQILV